jgi:cyclomaltodextrinase
MIYYGDEAGMWGADDPDDRKPMLWPDLVYEDEKACPLRGCTRPDDRNAFDDSLFAFYTKLVHERLSNPALTFGDYKTLVADNGNRVFIFERTFKTYVAIVGFNLSENDQQVALGVRGLEGRLWDVLNWQAVEKKGDMVDLKLPKGWGVLITNRAE